MSDSPAFIIEVQGRSAGIVIAEPRGYTFFAAEQDFFPLDRRHFRSVVQAENAARALIAGPRRSVTRWH
ncbi:MAG: hypothetical protein P4M00_24385 [Azospirillaceae bacterium]|nr:hypothetical protein [Azospirillaceae bacterium]